MATPRGSGESRKLGAPGDSSAAGPGGGPCALVGDSGRPGPPRGRRIRGARVLPAKADGGGVGRWLAAAPPPPRPPPGAREPSVDPAARRQEGGSLAGVRMAVEAPRPPAAAACPAPVGRLIARRPDDPA